MNSAELVQGIQQLLNAGQPDRERLTELATAYIQNCKEVNQRALRCRDLLTRDQRAEAIAEARNAPDLRSEVETLTFDERALWIQFCDQVGIDLRAFDLDAEFAARVVADLGADPNTRDALLSSYRLMALRQAGLGKRLPCLRGICRADPLNPGWQDDLRTFEAARLTELRNEVKEALKRGDLAALEGILKELRAPEWGNRSAEALARAIEDKMEPLRKAQYAALAEQIRAAHGAFDEAKCRDLLQQWDALIGQTQAQPEPADAGDVANAKAWIKLQDIVIADQIKFQGDCEALRRALDDEKPWAEIERLHGRLLRRDEFTPPEELVIRAQQYIESGKRADRLKRGLRIAGLVGAAVVVIAGAVAFWIAQARTVTLEDCQKRLEDQITEDETRGDFGPSDRIVEHFKKDLPQITDDRRIQELVAKLAEKKAAEEKRSVAFQSALAGARKHVDLARTLVNDTRKLVGESHTEAVLAQVAKGLNQVSDPLAEARKCQAKAKFLEKKETEKADVSVLASGIGNVEVDAKDVKNGICQVNREALVVARDAAMEKYQKAKEELGQVSAQSGKACDDFTAADAACRRIAERIVRTALLRDIAPEANAGLAGLDKMQKDIDALVVEIRGVDARLATIVKLFANAQSLKIELDAFRKEHPTHRLAAPFEEAAGLDAGWRAAEAWLKVAEGWSGKVRVTDAKAAQARLAPLTKYLGDYLNTPFKEAGEAYLAYLQKAVDALGGEEKLKGVNGIDSYLRGEKIANLCIVRTKDGKVRYVSEPEVKRQTAMPGKEILFVKSFLGKKGPVPEERIAEQELAEPVGTEWPAAPQSAFAKAAFKRFKEFNGAGWETFYLSLAGDLQSLTDIDAILRASSLTVLLEQANTCLPFKPKAPEDIDDVLRRLRKLDPNLDVDWINHRDKRANEERPRVAKFLAELKPFAEMAKDVDAQVDALAAPLAPYRPVGLYLARDGGLCLGAGVKIEQGGLYALIREGDPPAFTFRKIGSVPKGEKPVLVEEAIAKVPAVPAGAIIYTKADQ